MAEFHGTIQWPGLQDFDSASYTVSHGITPGVATIVVAVEHLGSIETEGDLVLSDGIHKPIVLKDCKLSDIQYTRTSTGGQGVQLSILDRRWKWAFGSISGWYNQRDDKNNLKDWTIQHLKTLINLCVQKMGEAAEAKFDIDEPDEDQLPSINWVETNPAREAAELAEQFGGRLVFQVIENRIVIAKPGNGADLPDEDYRDYTPSQDLPESPGKITVVSAPSVYQVALPLEAVGFEPSGKVKLIGDLSYKPESGWETAGRPPFFNGLKIPGALGAAIGAPGLIIAPLNRPGYESLAKSCIYRTYRVICRNVDGTELVIPGFDQKIHDLEDLILINGLVGLTPDVDGKPLVEPAKVYGSFANDGGSWTAPNSARFYEGSFSIDPDRWLVSFDQYMFRSNASGSSVQGGDILGGSIKKATLLHGEYGSAELVLLCSVMIRDRFTHQPVRIGRNVKFSDAKTEPLVVRKEDIQPVFTARYDPDKKFKLKGKDSNIKEVEAMGDFYINQAKKQFESRDASETEYSGLLPIDPDGAIQQITWTIGGGGPCMTRISRNTEHAHWLPTYKRRRGQEKLRAFFDIPKPIRDGLANPELYGGSSTGAWNAKPR